MSSLSPEKLSQWKNTVASDPTLSLAATVAANSDVSETLLRRKNKIEYSNEIFNVSVDPQGSPITNQKQSGRCWLFAATNCLRIPVMKKYNLEKFQLSPSYLFFYDKLEKANFFLNQIVDTAEEDADSRIVQHLLVDPVCDGGQFSMFTNIIKKYGLVPNTVYPDSFNSLASRQVNNLVITLLRQYAQELRELKHKGTSKTDLDTEIAQRMERIHQLLVIFLGAPPSPDEKFTWDYVDKDKKVGSVQATPLEFVKEVIEFNPEDSFSLLNDPRNEYKKVIHIERLGNVNEAEEVHYLNADIDTLSEQAINRLKANKPVFFGTHTPIYHHNGTGIIDTHLWDYEKIGFNPTQNKADRLRYHESLMTHAMTFTGVHLEDGKPVRWKVENSWGEEKGNKGYYTMSHDFFKEYVYQVVVEKNDAPDLAKLYSAKNADIHLPPWDPCGALAI